MSNNDRRPPRLHFINLDSGENMEAQFNPTEFEKSIGVNVKRQEVPGLSYKPIQYANTENMMIPLELYVGVETIADLERANELEKFFESLCYPKEAAQDVASGGLPRVLVVWPSCFAFVAQLTSGVKIRSTRFNIAGNCTEKTISFVAEEQREYRLTSEEVRANGSFRAPNGPEAV